MDLKDIVIAKAIFGGSSEGGGGGTSYTTLFEGSVTTVEGEEDSAGNFTASITADTIKVTFNGVEYTCVKLPDGGYGAEYIDRRGFDWSEYPFALYSENGTTTLITETAGTYTLKIEAPQSGGSSDFSTATVTINAPESFELTWDSCPMLIDNYLSGNLYVEGLPATITVPLYKGKCYWDRTTMGLTLSGNIEEYYEGMLITGDCTITIS